METRWREAETEKATDRLTETEIDPRDERKQIKMINNFVYSPFAHRQGWDTGTSHRGGSEGRTLSPLSASPEHKDPKTSLLTVYEKNPTLMSLLSLANA